uniref:DUF630 domain-containing protein n=2 Tax=Aegilops tauschii subsp. strangulata TaxID=200361 RepID=A0A452YVY3_AEGTS
MGCAASKVEQEDTVRRCKERRRNIKDAVAARQLLASAHADYLRSLRVTAAALSRFAQGHSSLTVSHHTAPVLLTTAAPPALHAPAPAAMSSVASSSLPPPTPLPRHQPPPPPPPQQQQPQQPQPQAAAAALRVDMDPRMRRLKVPHILSDSSVASSFRKPPVVGTPSSSSAWDWENFYPPSPPDSEFFDRRKTDLEEANRLRELDDEAKARGHPQRRHDHLKEEDEVDDSHGEDEEETEREDMHCGGWEDEEDHYASTTTSETRSEEGEVGNRSECGFAARSEYGGTAPSEYAAVPMQLRRAPRGQRSGTPSPRSRGRPRCGWWCATARSQRSSRPSRSTSSRRPTPATACRSSWRPAAHSSTATSSNSKRRCTTPTACYQHWLRHGLQSRHWLCATSWTPIHWRWGQWKGRAMGQHWSGSWPGKRSYMRRSRLERALRLSMRRSFLPCKAWNTEGGTVPSWTRPRPP